MNNIEQLEKYGFTKINLTQNLLSSIKDFYFDICKYLLIVIKDSTIEINQTLVTAFESAIKKNDLINTELLFQKILIIVNNKDRRLIGLLYDIGTQPMKLQSGNKLFSDPQIEQLINEFFRIKGSNKLIENLVTEKLYIYSRQGQRISNLTCLFIKTFLTLCRVDLN